MALFSKLKERLLKSSSRLGKEVDAIVEEGAVTSDPVPETTPDPAPVQETQPPAETTPAPADAAPAEAPAAGASTVAPDPIVPPAPAPQAEASRPGLLGRLMGRGKASEPRRVLDDDMLESLEEMLIASDMGVDTALRVTANIAEGRMGRRVSGREIRELLAQEIARVMEPVARPMPLYPSKPQVVLVVGVNGSGKTTTIGKLASQFRAAG